MALKKAEQMVWPSDGFFCYNIAVDDKTFETKLPPYLAHDLEAWKKGVEVVLCDVKMV